MNIYIINLLSEQGRAKFQKKQFDRLNLEFTRVNATSIDDVSSDTYQQVAFDWERPLSYPEVACYLSHRTLWQRVISEGHPALILEDDAYVCDDLPMLLEEMSALKEHYINLETRGRKKALAGRAERRIGEYKLRHLYYGGTGAAAYVLWPEGAEKLLQKERQAGFALADAHICRTIMGKAWQLDYAAAIQLDCCAAYNLKAPYQTNSSLAKTRFATSVEPQEKVNFKKRRLISQFRLAGTKLRAVFKGGRLAKVMPNTDRFNLL